MTQFNQIVQQQTDFYARHFSEILDKSVGGSHREAMATAAREMSLIIHGKIIGDDPFPNGNKRTALVAMLVFLDENGIQLTADEDDLFRFVLLVAQHRLVPRGADDLADREVMEITRWIKRQSRRSEHGERVL